MQDVMQQKSVLGNVPSRIQSIDMCYLWYRGTEPDSDLLELVRPDQLLIVTCPDACPRLIGRFREAGGLVLVYGSIYKAPLLEEVPSGWSQWEGGSPDHENVAANPFWQAVDVKAFPDAMRRYDDGEPRRPFNQPNYMPGWYQVTATDRDYADAVVRGAELVARDDRFDGMFIDNYFSLMHHPAKVRRDGKLMALDPAEHDQAVVTLLERMAEAARAVADEHFWLAVNGNAADRVQHVVDLAMHESLMFSWASPEPRCTQDQAEQRLAEFPVLRKRGGRLIALGYFGFGGRDVNADARMYRDMVDRCGAIFADFFSIARPDLIGAFAQQNREQGGEGAEKALAKITPGNRELAREIYRLSGESIGTARDDATSPAQTWTFKQRPVHVFADKASLGMAAATKAAGHIRSALASCGCARVMIGTGPSQDETVDALVNQPNLNWSKIQVFHMDEYVGIDANHPASFRRWLRQRVVDRVQPGKVHYLQGDSADLDEEIARWEALLAEGPIDVCFVGFGENGHIAFNDPHVADFSDTSLVKRVQLDERCRQQQVGEGHFATLNDVPVEAITVTCPALMRANHLICPVPDHRKAQAVRQAIEGPLSTTCPASLVFTHPDAEVFLDTASASLLNPTQSKLER